MDASAPSRTALRVALRRAAHQILDRPLVFEDPLAVRILGRAYAEDLRRTPTRPDRPFSVGLRAFLVARSQFVEDVLRRAVRSGATQYVVLGAGLDTFAYRNPYPELEVFEVDHPATQAWKRDLLRESGTAIPDSVHYVPVDFEREQLRERLVEEGFDGRGRTFYSMLGVVPYLTLEAFRGTIRFVASSPPGSGLAFDYGQPAEVLSPTEKLAHESLSSRVALAGEPFRLFFTPADMERELQDFGAIDDLGAVEINARYFADRADGLEVRGSAGRIVSATVRN